MNCNVKLLILIVFISVVGCVSSQPAADNYSRVARRINQRIRNEIPIGVSGFGAMIPNQIHAYSMLFDYNRPISVELARKHVLRMVQIILDDFNSDISIQEYLENRPFTAKNVSFMIFIDKWDQFQPPENFVSVISFIYGKITYEQYDTTKGELILLFSETYEEALERAIPFKSST